MAKRRELVAKLTEDHNIDAAGLLESLVAYLPEYTVINALHEISHLEDWHVKIDEDGKIQSGGADE